MNRDLREFRRLERACREHAALAPLPIERDALLKVAEDYRSAIEARVRAEHAQQAAQDYADDQRALSEKFRRMMD